MLNKITINENKTKLIVYVFLATVTLAIYWQVNHFDFVNYDDNWYVTENGHVQSGITSNGFILALTAKCYVLWDPLVWLSLMLDYEIYGLNAGGYHITNLILHILSTLLLFWLFARMTRQIWPSAFVAAFFALHPLHVESVAWVSERKDVLSAFFWMLTLCLYVYYTEKPAVKRYLMVLFAFVLALMSKPMVVTLPLIMILLDYWPLKRFDSRKDNLLVWQVKEKLSFFILSGIVALINVYNPNYSVKKYLSLDYRILNDPIAFVTYILKTFWPYDMTAFYAFPAQIPLLQVSGALFFIIMMTITVVAMIKRLPYLFVGWFWYMITLLPIMLVLSDEKYAIADRYHYLPSVGISVMVAWLAPSLFKSAKIRKKILFPATMISLIFLASVTWKQCGYWKNSIALWNHALFAIKDNVFAHNMLGRAYFKKGETDKAVYYLNKAINLSPNFFLSYQNLGSIYQNTGRHELAIKHYTESIRRMPDNAESYYGRGSSYIELNQYQSAINDLNISIHQKPDYADAFNNRAFIFLMLGQYQKAFEDYNRAILIKPYHAKALNNRAFIYLSTGNTGPGCLDAEKACKLETCSTLQFATANNLCR